MDLAAPGEILQNLLELFSEAFWAFRNWNPLQRKLFLKLDVGEEAGTDFAWYQVIGKEGYFWRIFNPNDPQANGSHGTAKIPIEGDGYIVERRWTWRPSSIDMSAPRPHDAFFHSYTMFLSYVKR